MNQKHLKSLNKNHIEFDRDLCQIIDKPTLQLLYKRYCAINDIRRQIDQKIKDRTWKGAALTKVDVIELFVNRSIWYAWYSMPMRAAENNKDMRAWITEADDAPSDENIWGTIKDHRTLTDLDGWLKAKTGIKPTMVMKVKGKAAVKGKETVKGKANANTSQGTGKEKEKEVKPKVARSHKKKPATG